MRSHCTHETEVAAAVRSGEWPHAVAPQLCDHVRHCRYCRELLTISRAFHQERRAAMQAANLPSPSALWWRAQLRRKYSAASQAIRPIAWAERLAVFSLVLSVFGIAVWQAPQAAYWFSSVSNLLRSGAVHLKSAADVFANSLPAIFIAGSLALLCAMLVAMYFSSQDV